MKPSIERELKLWTALKRISLYHDVRWLQRNAENKYGLDPEEAICMAYENVLGEAKQVLRGMRRPELAEVAPVAPHEARGPDQQTQTRGES